MSSESPRGFSRRAAITVALFVLFGLVFLVYYGSERSIDQANFKRYQSQMLADELRQTSDDLTTMARTYVATLEIQYRKWFEEILLIRDGQRPMPPNYQRIYWNFLAAGVQPPGGTGTQASGLIDRMKEAGFT